ncbi:hypothetical protein NDU88_003395 [Pleurodeles waltl]|uniref:Uncharacterized protein n=1 Tax=Pleurodeles waltl TaxID=8319 RepID=A0AAV7TQZ9_PLEWA|nr:hypothetical protein NDU88_003395 [Pleurodeles waltl]
MVAVPCAVTSRCRLPLNAPSKLKAAWRSRAVSPGSRSASTAAIAAVLNAARAGFLRLSVRVRETGKREGGERRGGKSAHAQGSGLVPPQTLLK